MTSTASPPPPPPPPLPTAAAARAAGLALGLEGPALTDFVRLGAHARHEARVHRVLDVARAAVGGDDAKAHTLCALDVIGRGGHCDLEGRSTLRVPPFRGLGKGRKQASDGEAWTGAVEGALFRLARALTDAGDGDGALTPERVLALLAELPELVAWVRVAALLGLQEAAGAPRRRELPVVLADDPEAWARVLMAAQPSDAGSEGDVGA